MSHCETYTAEGFRLQYIVYHLYKMACAACKSLTAYSQFLTGKKKKEKNVGIEKVDIINCTN